MNLREALEIMASNNAVNFKTNTSEMNGTVYLRSERGFETLQTLEN
jgi:hypothetical protein